MGLSARGGWLRYNDGTAYSVEGAVRICDINSVYHGAGDSFITVGTHGNNFITIENATVDEVLHLIRAEEDDSHISVIAQQARRIAELEEQISDG